jgi:hypothetical protein
VAAARGSAHPRRIANQGGIEMTEPARRRNDDAAAQSIPVERGDPMSRIRRVWRYIIDRPLA